ncbi:hypothetical protein [Streptomyces anandii]|uniref:hypothetical protein n=1 Tax=Streptomyces anandii TaxID=285454 RepID=UPI0037B04C47
MDTLTPPEPATPAPHPTPSEPAVFQPAAVEPALTLPTGPVCALCGQPALVHWQRRPTDAEIAEMCDVEKQRRAQVLRLADPQQPAPVFGPLPTAEDITRIVHSCGAHAITLEGATLIHQSCCTAPNEADLPGCDCLPEQPPQPRLAAEPEPAPLPAHWQPGGP